MWSLELCDITLQDVLFNVTGWSKDCQLDKHMACPVETDAYQISIAVFVTLWALAIAVLSAVLLLNGTGQISNPHKIETPEPIRI